MVDEHRIDVAISFLAADEPLAIQLHNRLVADGLSVFVYSKAQEQIAGGDGTEEFRRAFHQDSRIAVVLYREPWGSTPWTRVEQDAVQERALKGGAGWEFLLFVMLNNAKPPAWLPEVRIRLHYAEYGFEQTIGAIKNRAERAGSIFRPIDAIAQAQFDAAEAAFLTRRRNFFDSKEGGDAQKQAVIAVFGGVQGLCEAVRQTTGQAIQLVGNDMQLVMRADGVSVSLTSALQQINRAQDGAMVLREHEGHVLGPGESGWYGNGEPATLGEYRFDPEVAQDLSWRWKDGDRLLTSEQLADSAVKRMLALLRRARAGDFPRLRF